MSQSSQDLQSTISMATEWLATIERHPQSFARITFLGYRAIQILRKCPMRHYKIASIALHVPQSFYMMDVTVEYGLQPLTRCVGPILACACVRPDQLAKKNYDTRWSVVCKTSLSSLHTGQNRSRCGSC